jgi:arsenical pump membrane protein
LGVVAIQLLDGVAAGIFGVISIIIAADLMRGTGRFNLAQGLVALSTGLGAAASNVFAGFVVQVFGYTTGFLLWPRLPSAGFSFLLRLCPKPNRRMKFDKVTYLLFNSEFSKHRSPVRVSFIHSNKLTAIMFLFFSVPAIWKTGLTCLVGLATLIGIMTRPFRWNEAIIAMVGAAVLLLLGLITPADAFLTLIRDWNTFLFFLGMMGLSALAEAAGLFDWLAVQAARLAGQSAARLFLNVFLLGTLISMVLSNDATALILTPIVYVLVTKLRLPVLPYLFACTFIADTASFLLPVSNPINIIITSRFPLDLLTFLRLLFLPSLVVIVINFGIFYLLYRKQLKGAFDIQRLPSAEEATKHKGYFRYTCCVLAAVAVAYVIASAVQLPLSLIALSGAVLLLIGALAWRRISLPEIGSRVSWSIFGFIAGMFIVVRAIEDTGLTTMFGNWLIHLSGDSSFGAVMVGMAGAAVGTNLINNVPMAVVMVSALGGIQHASPAIQHGFIAATIFGCDLGPNLTTVGSLATVLWLLILRQRNVDVTGLDYFKVGVVVTPLMLLAGALTIWLLL